jgi:hypothetical protein
MRHNRLLLLGIVVGVAVSGVSALAASYPISREQVAAAVNRLGMPVAPEQVTLLADVVATTSAPRLTVRSIEPWGNQRMTARIECESSDQCLPFFVSLNTGSGASAQPVAVAQTYLTSQSPSGSSPRHFAVKSGTPATLLLDGDRVHIRLSVVCLESGAPGQTIRVTDREHKMVFHAQVVDGGLLKGRL